MAVRLPVVFTPPFTCKACVLVGLAELPMVVSAVPVVLMLVVPVMLLEEPCRTLAEVVASPIVTPELPAPVLVALIKV